jgi:ribonucleoside-diphosphate reductase subunit M1
MYSHVSERSGLKAPLIADDVYDIIMKVGSQTTLTVNN